MSDQEEATGARTRTEGFALVGLGVGARFVGMAGGALAGLATTALAVRLLGTTSYGTFAFAFSAAAVFGGIGRLGLEPAVARSTAILEADGDRQGMARIAIGAFTLVAVTGIIGTIATLAVVELASHGLSSGGKLVLGGFLGIMLYGANVTAVGAGLARATGRVAVMELSILVPALGKLTAVGAVTALDLADPRWVAAGYALGATAGIVAAWGAARVVLGRYRAFVPDLGAAREMFVASLPFAAGGLAVVVISRFDVVVLGLTGTQAEVGAYEPALKVVEQAMLLVPLLFVAQYLPVASRAFARQDQAEFRELYIGLSKLVFIAAAPAVILFAAFPEAVLHTLYGADFPASSSVVWLLLAGYVLNNAFGLNSPALSATGNRPALARTGLVATAAMVVLALALVPPLGANGAAAATAGTYVILNAAVGYALWNAAGLHPFRTDFVLTMLSWLVPLGAALAVRASNGEVGFWPAVGVSVAVSTAWIAALFAARVVRRSEVTRLLPGGR